MNSKDITLWLDERWYDALSRHLKGETLEEHLEDVLDEMCSQLPQQEYERISAEIWREKQENDREREASRRFAVFHVTERGHSDYFLAEEPLEFLQTAHRLRSYIRKATGDAPAHFTEMFPRGEKLSREQFEKYVSERLDNTGRVVGAFDINLDEGCLDALNIMDGWKRFRIKDVSSAVYFAMKKKQCFTGRAVAYLSESSAGERNHIRDRAAVPHRQSDTPCRGYLFCGGRHSERQPAGVLHGSTLQRG